MFLLLNLALSALAAYSSVNGYQAAAAVAIPLAGVLWCVYLLRLQRRTWLLRSRVLAAFLLFAAVAFVLLLLDLEAPIRRLLDYVPLWAIVVMAVLGILIEVLEDFSRKVRRIRR